MISPRTRPSLGKEWKGHPAVMWIQPEVTLEVMLILSVPLMHQTSPDTKPTALESIRPWTTLLAVVCLPSIRYGRRRACARRTNRSPRATPNTSRHCSAKESCETLRTFTKRTSKKFVICTTPRARRHDWRGVRGTCGDRIAMRSRRKSKPPSDTPPRPPSLFPKRPFLKTARNSSSGRSRTSRLSGGFPNQDACRNHECTSSANRGTNPTQITSPRNISRANTFRAARLTRRNKSRRSDVQTEGKVL
mmetsp:Transcript_7149/g.23929  ORF Transcript_7149/g.23929 Transcript_7149/m.23929 type:complete len:248 (+) Transcript_7149:2603-3346(+)